MPKSVFTPAYKHLLSTLVAARKGQDVSQAELAQRLGKPQQWVSSVETGIRRIDLIEFYAVAHALGLEPSALAETVFSGLPRDVTV